MSTRVLGDRALGWLRFLHRKATTPDDWSSAGRPARWWDDRSTPPVLNFARFDLSESSYAVPMMADVTPAWREVYVEIMDGLVARHTTYWAAIDWLTQIGHDPDRARYPEELVKLWLPQHLAGDYDMPGWTANGVEPWGLAPDPVAAEGNLFFKGWFNLLLGFHGYVSRDRRWNEPFAVTGLDDQPFSWTHDGINALLTRQWTARPEGPHCENTKIWPYCLSAAGLGLRMHDILTGGSDHWVYDQWVDIARERFLGLTPGGHVEWMALYHDPIADYTHRAGPTAGLSVAIYMLPQEPALAEILYRTAVDKIGWSDPARPVRSLPDPRFLLLGIVLAREFGDEITHARLTAYAAERFEPGFAAGSLERDEFGWGFGLDEPYPRGQLNGLLMMAEIGAPGAWSRVFTEPNLDKFDEPTVCGVDFPRLGVREAWNSGSALTVGTYAATASERGAPTTIRVTQLPDAASSEVLRDGVPYPRWRVLDPRSIEIDLDIGEHRLQVLHPGSTTTTQRHEDHDTGLAPPGREPQQVAAPDRAAGGDQVQLGGVPRPPCACC
ncbi:hypothetical protein [Pseudonocardia spinosispora]|uniref:linalool dehydratase/isomerase domain-containing protein n=1 Tax=Pseudonocardia spinosispora TaxID=103441 RepID=UPI00040B913E|nr:hypothetical protein [Pseudonocardia spinosispora]